MKTLGRLITVLVLFSVPAFSQGNDVTFFAGVQLPKRVTLSDATQTITNPKDVGTFGLRIGHGNVWGGEHTVAFTSGFLDGNSKAFIYTSNFRIQGPFPVVKPYATAGMGTIITWGTGLSDVGSKFAINYGGGVKVMPSGPVGINFGLRGYAIPGVQSQTLHIAEASVGIVIGF